MSHACDYEKNRLLLQARLDALKTQEDRNRLGQFATPTALALDIVRSAKKLIASCEKVKFLDPAFGTGSFFSAMLSAFPNKRIEAAEGFEIDPHYGQPAADLWHGTPLRLHLDDFTRQEAPEKESQRFNLIICNPPYVRHHHLQNGEKVRLQRLAEKRSGTRMSGLAGLYCYFLCLCHAWMRKNAVAVWLIPSEFMDVNYGGPVKDYLVSRVTLLRIHRFDPREVQFGDALVSSAVMWFRNDVPRPQHQVEFTFGGTIGNPTLSRTIPIDILSEEPKWTRFPAAEGRAPEKASVLGDFFTIKRGIATGGNGFFIQSRQRIADLGIPMECFRPVLPSPRYLKTEEILADDHGNPLIEPELFLLDCALPEHKLERLYPALWRYLEAAKAVVSKGYLCTRRSPWYSQETRPPAPIVCTYMGRQDTKRGTPFRFFLNHSKATATNVYLLLYPRPPLQHALAEDHSLIREVWRVLSSIPLDDLIGEGRVYGGSLHKLEPKELANVSADDLSNLLNNRLQRQVQRILFSASGTAPRSPDSLG